MPASISTGTASMTTPSVTDFKRHIAALMDARD